ncbi:uncharacterized protein [Palaemon carinicauda]|uniref:uncharacterized protein n=1 Tax=Palaemon carinicauda TaxID=392227 RepID=UPI0035B6638A
MDSGVGTSLQPRRCFANIHGDVVGLLPTLQGHRYLFTAINQYSRWSEAIPVGTATSASCTSAALSGWIARLGIPEHITSNRGTTFISQSLTSIANLLGITLYQTTAYSPAANCMAEHYHITLKVALMSHCKDSNQFMQLPWVILGLRTTPTDALNVSQHLKWCMATSWSSLLSFFYLQPPPTISSAYVTLWENLLHATRVTIPQLSNTYRHICTQE